MIDPLQIVFNLFIVSAMIIITAILIRNKKNLLSPAVIIFLVWTMLISSIYFFIPSYDLHSLSLLWILLSLCLFLLGFLPKIQFKKYKNSEIPFRFIKQTRLILLTFIVVGFLSPITLIVNAGYDLLSIFNYETLTRIGNYYSVLRYGEEGYREPLLHTFFTLFVFSGSFLGGFIAAFHYKNKFWIIISLFSLFPALLITLILTTKATFLFAGSFWLSSYLSSLLYINREKQSILDFNNIKKMLLLLLFAVLAYSLGHIIRLGNISRGIDTLFTNISTAFLGSTAAFSKWFTSNDSNMLIPIGYGVRTFNGPFSLLFDISLPRFDPTFIGQGLIYQDTTIHTLFRELIYDFSILGALIIMFLLGVISKYSYTSVYKGKFKGIPLLSLIYVILLISFIGSPFKYNTIILSWVFFYLYIKFGISIHLSKIS
jgi:oligosaccharide repeat unit polymerase